MIENRDNLIFEKEQDMWRAASNRDAKALYT